MDYLYANAAALAQERRLAQLSDDNAFLDTQALMRQEHGGSAHGSSSLAAKGVGGGVAGAGPDDDDRGHGRDTALSRLRGHSQVHLPSSYASQHKAYLDMWAATWRKVEKRSSSDSDDDDDDDADGGSAPLQGGIVPSAAKGKTKRSRSGPNNGKRRRSPPPPPLSENQPSRRTQKLQRGERRVVNLRDAEAVAEALAEELRLLKAWHAIQSTRRSPVTLRHHRRANRGKHRESAATATVSGPTADGAADSDYAASFLGMTEEEALRVSQRRGNGEDALQSVDPGVLLALTRCPSHIAMRAPPPAPTPIGVSMATSAAASLSSSPASGLQRPARSRGGGNDGGAEKTSSSSLAPLAAQAPGTVGGVHGGHLCSVCLKPAAYRCVRCKTALFCCIDCHAIHDATRCLKYIV